MATSTWQVVHCGYLAKKRRYATGWHSRFCLLENGELSSYTDETRRTRTGSFILGSSSLVRVLNGDTSYQGRGPENAFVVFDPSDDYLLRQSGADDGADDGDDALMDSMIFDTSLDESFEGTASANRSRLSSNTSATDSYSASSVASLVKSAAGQEKACIKQAPFLLAAEDSESLETWMIALIQAINGAYRPEENFAAGPEAGESSAAGWTASGPVARSSTLEDNCVAADSVVDDVIESTMAVMQGPLRMHDEDGTAFASPALQALRNRWPVVYGELLNGELCLYEPHVDASSSDPFEGLGSLSAHVEIARGALQTAFRGVVALPGAALLGVRGAGLAAFDRGRGCVDGDGDGDDRSSDIDSRSSVDRIEQKKGRLLRSLSLAGGAVTVVVPYSICGQRRCLAVVRTEGDGRRSSMRLSCADDPSFFAWAAALRLRVACPPVSAEYRASIQSIMHAGGLLSPVMHAAGSAGTSALRLLRAGGEGALTVPRTLLLWGRHNIAPLSELETVYREHFVFSCAGSASAEAVISVCVLENQRYIALRGYSSDNLLPGDRWHLTSNSGQRFPHPSLVDAPPPLPYRWRAAQAEEAVGGWSIDRSHRDTDDAGWAYCRSFEPSVTLDGGSAAPSPRQGDMVRFRRWVRCALLDL